MVALEGSWSSRTGQTKLLLCAAVFVVATTVMMLQTAGRQADVVTLRKLREIDATPALVASSASAEPPAHNSSAASPMPPPAERFCCPETGDQPFTEAELRFNRQRLQAWQGQPAGAGNEYVAICSAVRDQHASLAEWIEWHLALGVSRIYITDAGSQPPLAGVLQPYTEAGSVVLHNMSDPQAETNDLLSTTGVFYPAKYHSLLAMARCLRDYGTRHRWIGFLDAADEFLVINDGTPNLPSLLRDYEEYGGLGINWRNFGSNGHRKHQPNTLVAYTSCFGAEDPDNKHIKTIVNTAFAMSPRGPHHARYIDGRFAVTTARERVDGPLSEHIAFDRLILHHYTTKSHDEFKLKMQRGSGMGNKKTWEFWDWTHMRSVARCTAAADAWRRMQQAAGRAAGPAVTVEEVASSLTE